MLHERRCDVKWCVERARARSEFSYLLSSTVLLDCILMPLAKRGRSSLPDLVTLPPAGDSFKHQPRNFKVLRIRVRNERAVLA
jgi:hypothetical protein